MSVPPCEVCGGLVRESFVRWGHSFGTCVDCGLIRIHPQPTDQILEAIYGDHYYRAWGMHRDPEAARGVKASTFRRHLQVLDDLPRGSRVLDCGAALGFLMEVATEMGFEAYGVDRSPLAASSAEWFGPGRFYFGSFETATFPALGERPFDALFMFDFLEHVRDPREVLLKAAALLRPGGRLLLTTPDAQSISRRLLGSAWPHVKLEHLFCFNRTNIVRLLESTFFREVEVTPARKIMSLDYVSAQFEHFPLWPVTPLLRGVVAVAPARLRRRHFAISLGEMFVQALRTSGPRDDVSAGRGRSGRSC